MFWSGWVKDCKGGGLGRGWAGGWWCGYRHRSAKGATSESRKPRTPPPFQSTPPRRERPATRCMQRCTTPISIHAPAKGATAIFHKIINLYCETSTNTTRINSLNINKKYINRIKARILNYFFGANHLINLCKLYIRTCDL